MSLDEIERRSSPSVMVIPRLDRLLTNGFLREEVNGYALTEKGERTLQIFERLRHVFRHPSLEADATQIQIATNRRWRGRFQPNDAATEVSKVKYCRTKGLSTCRP